MKKTAIALIGLLAFASVGMAAEYRAELDWSVKMPEQSIPADAVIESEGVVGIYDAFSGSYTRYTDGTAAEPIVRDGLKNGNCLVKATRTYFFCDDEAGRVVVLDAGMNALTNLTLPKELAGTFDPTDVAAFDGFAFVVDNDNHRIVKFDLKTGKVVKAAGSYGEGRGNFWYPYAVVRNAAGNLFISEVLNTRVQELSASDLVYFGFTGRWGVEKGELYRPTGIAAYGPNLLVADGYLGFINVFNNNGDFVDTVSDEDGTRLEFGSPTHIRVSGNTLVVVDAYTRTVFVYTLKVEQ